jgi:hypothetical protein
LLRFKVINEKE